MKTTRLRRHDLTLATAASNSATLAVASLYSSTHSVTVTLIGASTSVLMTSWLTWLSRTRNERPPLAKGESLPSAHAKRAAH